MAKMKMSDTTKTILIATGIVAATVGGIIIANKIKKNRWGKGKKRHKDTKFNPKNQIKLALVGEQGYANIRKSPKIDDVSAWETASNPLGWFSPLGNVVAAEELLAKHSNLIGKVKSGTIGTIIEERKGDKGHYWVKVKLAKPIKSYNKKTYNYGWVREDVIRIKIQDK